MLICVVEPNAFDSVVSEALGVTDVQESTERLQQATEGGVASYLRTHGMPAPRTVELPSVDEGTPLFGVVEAALEQCREQIEEEEEENATHALVLVVSGARPPIGADDTWADVARKAAAAQRDSSVMVYLVVDRIEEELRDDVDRVALAFQGMACELGVDGAAGDVDAAVLEAVEAVCHRFLRPAEAILALGHAQTPVTLIPNPHLGWHRARGFASPRDAGDTRVPAVLPVLAFLPADAVHTPPAVSRHTVATLPRAASVATQAGTTTLLGMLKDVMASERVTALLRLDEDAYALLAVAQREKKGRRDAVLHVLEPGSFLPWLPPVSRLVLRTDAPKLRDADGASDLLAAATSTSWAAGESIASTDVGGAPVFSEANVQAALSLVRRLGDKLPQRKERLVGVVQYLHDVASVYGIDSLPARVLADLTASMAAVAAADGDVTGAYAVVDPLADLFGGRIDRDEVEKGAKALSTPSRKKKKRPRESDADEDEARVAKPVTTSKRARSIKRPKRLENGADMDDIDAAVDAGGKPPARVAPERKG